MKTKNLLHTTGLTILFVLLITLFTNAQIPIKGLAVDNEGIACWNADGSGPEPEGNGHIHPFGLSSVLYYGASRDYVDANSNAAMCHFMDNITGFPLFVQALADNGFTSGQVKIKLGLSELKNDIEGEDWFTFNGKHYMNRYDAYYYIELNGEPMISGYINFFNILDLSSNSFWESETNFTLPFDASENSSMEVKEVAAAFLTDMDGEELRFVIINSTVSGSFSGPGVIGGAYFDINEGYLEKGLPELPFSGLASNHQGLACWDADGTGPEPEASGHTYSWNGTDYTMPYYVASRDYDGIDPDNNAATGYITDELDGFPNLKIQLEYRGFTLDQLKLKTGLGSLGNDIEDIDWGYNGSIHWYNYYGYNNTFEIAGEPILESVSDTNHGFIDLAITDKWWSISSFSKVTDISNTASSNAQYVALSFLKDLGGHSLGSYVEGYFAGNLPPENGRVDGVFMELQNSKLIARQPAGTHIWDGEVSGTWNIAGSPYIVMGELNVPDGEVLEIDPGVVVKFNTTERFLINGCIVAEGTEENPILFTALDNEVRWGGLGWDQTPATNETSILKHCIFEYAYAYNYINLPGYNSGAAIAVNDYENIEISNCLFRYNLADKPGDPLPTGGAIGLHESSLHISHCIFHNNRAGHGGAITLSSHSNAVIDNCLFYDNEAMDWFGGAIMTNTDCSPLFINCTFADNFALKGGGAVDLEIGGTATFTNCILWGNKADAGPDQISIWDPDISFLNVYYCDVEDGENGITPGFQGNYEENINEDPEFLGPLGGEPYYAISSSSPCINMGTLDDLYIPADWTCPLYCLCGNPRVYGWEIDMGGYETIVTGINEEIVQSSVSFNVFPNPINSNPSIEFYLENETLVQISILDIHGRIVSKILIEELQKGNNQVSWNAEKISSGIYFCQLKIGNELITRKVVKIE